MPLPFQRFFTPSPSTVTIELEPEADRRRLRMSEAGSRDQTVSAVQTGGWRAFERPLSEVVFDCCRRWPGMMIDAGANTGWYALLALAAHRRNRVVAFEPDARVLPLLRANLQANGWSRRAKVCAAALSDRRGEAPLYLPRDEHGLVETSSSLEPGFRDVHMGSPTVAMTTLDAELGEGSEPVLIKIDVEGHEAHVLAGALKTIARARPIIAVEILGAADPTPWSALLVREGYRAFALRPDHARAETEVRFDPSAWNHLIAPEEKTSALEAMLRHRGLLR